MPMFLSLVWFKVYPARFGGQKGVALFNKHLSTHYPVDCLCSSNNIGAKHAGYRIIPALPIGKLQFLNPFNWNRILRFCKNGRYTHAVIEYPYYGLIGILLKRLGTVFILHTHNIEADRFRGLGKWWWPILRSYEKWCMRKADLVLFKTKQDQKFAEELYQIPSERAYILPYGVERNKWNGQQESRAFLENRYNIKPDEKIILFAATLDYAPNANAMVAIYRHLENMLSKRLTTPFKILITGRNEKPSFHYLKELKSPNVVQAGFVEDIDPYFKGVDLFINPVLHTYGIQTKVLDALSFNCNVVIFEASNVELPSYLLNKKIFVAKNKDYSDFATQVVQGLSAENDTPIEFYNDYGWDKLVTQFVHHLSKIGLL
jgi:polysaccharide biosynthesis protein PslH